MSRLLRPSSVLICLTLLFAGAGCRRAPEAPPAPKELETIDVTTAPAPDPALSTADDAQERRVTQSLAGALPDGFPGDVPLFRPASLVDLAAHPEGGQSAQFDTPAARSAVESWMAQRLRANGWSSGAGGSWTLGARRIRVTVESRPAGSRFTIVY